MSVDEEGATSFGRVADRYMSDALRAIWDHPDELPPQLERLGEELISNG